MNALRIVPCSEPLHATVQVPGSKSLTNRALLIAALADGSTTLTNALFSDDTRRFIESLERLGYVLEILASESRIRVHGRSGLVPSARAELFVGNAGTAARFLTPLLTLGHGEYSVDGDARMRERPIGDLLAALRQLGVVVQSATGRLPLVVRANGLSGGRTSISGDVSSQFLSGLLMVAPCAAGALEIAVEGELSSKPYVDMTLAMMADFGVTVGRADPRRFLVTPQRYRARAECAIECDASSASYFFAAAAACGGSVRVEKVSRRSRQGDVGFVDVLARMGCGITEGLDWIEVTGPGRGQLRGIDVDLRDLPDTAQTLAAIAPFANGPVTIRGIASARMKETDRVAAMSAELARLGVPVEEYPDGLTIHPCASLRAAAIRTYDDHRMAMAFALVGLRASGISIENPECVAKTFPGYFDVLERLRH